MWACVRVRACVCLCVCLCVRICSFCMCKPASKSSLMTGGKNQFKEAAGKQLNCLKENLIFLSNFHILQRYR